ncbi:tetratricopeptide repeat protein [Archangium gephyra]|nr:tetratricopeptide repeat protein [Archangium gephyra]
MDQRLIQVQDQQDLVRVRHARSGRSGDEGLDEAGTNESQRMGSIVAWNPMNELHTRGLALLRAGREHEAATRLREAVSLGPDDARARYHLAIAHRLRGELTEARNELLAALELEPTLAPACAQLGGLALVAGELQEAMSWLSRALAIHPGHRISRYQLGVALRFAGHRAEAISLLQSSLEPGLGALPPCWRTGYAGSSWMP